MTTCPVCNAPIIVVNSLISRDRRSRIRYHGCRQCGFRPPDNKTVIPLEYAPPRNLHAIATGSNTADNEQVGQV